MKETEDKNKIIIVCPCCRTNLLNRHYTRYYRCSECKLVYTRLSIANYKSNREVSHNEIQLNRGV